VPRGRSGHGARGCWLPREGDGRGCRFRAGGMQGLVEPGGPTTITFPDQPLCYISRRSFGMVLWRSLTVTAQCMVN
jgi:hypothetical protein